MAKTVKVITPVFRVCFPNVFRPRPQKNDDGTEGAPKYGVTAVWDPKRIAAIAAEQKRWDAMMRIADEAAMEMFKKPLSKLPANFKRPIRDGAEKEHLDGFGPGLVFASLTSKMKPGIVAADGVTPIEDEEGFYPGCYARASVVAYAYDNKGKGVAFGLNNLMFVRDGERLDSRTDAADDFKDLGEEPEDLEELEEADPFS